jgi:xanthine/CO dehydrogenase XdhC/CoxF family maturation factor
MRSHKLLTGFLLAAISLVTVAMLRRRAARRRERADLYFDDGSMVSLVEGSAEAERLLPLARDVLQAAR